MESDIEEIKDGYESDDANEAKTPTNCEYEKVYEEVKAIVDVEMGDED